MSVQTKINLVVRKFWKVDIIKSEWPQKSLFLHEKLVILRNISLIDVNQMGPKLCGKCFEKKGFFDFNRNEGPFFGANAFYH